MPKVRLDILLVERGMAESRAKAQALIMAGQVRVDGQVVDRAAAKLLDDAKISLDKGPRFVSRGGEKLDAALTTFPISVSGRICADVGASTGGFTDCLLQKGAEKVFAIDVGKGILHWKLRTDPRVVVMEETNARFVESLPQAVDLVVIDASFISLKILLPVVLDWFRQNQPSPSASNASKGEVIALIKPQFEAGRKETARNKGVIRNPLVHRAVLVDVLTFASEQGFEKRGLMRSPILGPKGNIEFLVWLGIGDKVKSLDSLIIDVMDKS
jgi:23S rRNA (cytidine1920-2'-O)/16S rRNA (cytidine1409-2'-O)-methyltransferase